MSQRITESTVEDFCLEALETQGYRFVSPEELNRQNPEEVIVSDTRSEILTLLNPNIPEQARDTLLPKLMKGEIRIENF